jgi:hypothetical protein
VLGKPDPLPVDLERPELHGYEIRGYGSGATTGYAVASAGDLNNDGRADTLIGAPWVNCCDGGDAFIVFGKATPEPVLLDQLGVRGQSIEGPRVFENMGTSVASVGDVNSDDVQDFALGAPFASHRHRKWSGSVYIVFGNREAATVSVRDPASGVRIDGVRGRRCDDADVCTGDRLGTTLAPLGDLDDDGRPELLIGAPYAGNQSHRRNGRAYVVELP